MITSDQLAQVKDLVYGADSIMVMFAPTASYDQVALATSLFLGLESLGKSVSLLSSDLVGDRLSSLVASDRVTTKMGNKNLHVVFDYKNKESVDKVSYHIDEENEKFYLVVQPQKGFSPLDAKSVEFDYAGAEADLVFVVGVNDYEKLNTLYYGYEDFYDSSTTISINNFQASIANVNLDGSDKVSLCEVGLELLETLGVQIDSNMATNLLAGLEESTQSFTSFSTTAGVFQSAGKLMGLGARRINRKQAASSKQQAGEMKANPLAEKMKSGKITELQRSKESKKQSDKGKKIMQSGGEIRVGRKG